MRHKHAGTHLNRNSEHRIAMFRNMTMALIRHERIITTVAKAKALRPYVEKLITLARKGDLHSRRQVLSKLGPSSNAEVKPDADPKKADTRTILQKLFSEIGPRFKDRPGGYTRIIKRAQRRLGDAGETAYIELLKENEVPARRDRAPAPAPAPVPAPETREESPVAQEPAPAPEQQAEGEQKPQG